VKWWVAQATHPQPMEIYMTTFFWSKPARTAAQILNRQANGECVWVVENTSDGLLCIAKYVWGVRVGYL
jgi:hypothetical protein